MARCAFEKPFERDSCVLRLPSADLSRPQSNEQIGILRRAAHSTLEYACRIVVSAKTHQDQAVIEERGVIVRKQRLGGFVFGQRVLKPVQLAIRSRSIETVAPLARRQSDGGIEVRQCVRCPPLANQNLTQVVTSCGVSGEAMTAASNAR